MKLMRSEDILIVPISAILEPDWDIRNSPEDQKGLIALANSIKKDGFINPITCIKAGSKNKYKVIAGRRRLKAAKMIGLKEIPIYVKNDMMMDAELDYRRVALIENCHRKDMVGSERAHGFFEVYKMAGYTKQQVIKGVKSIDNWFGNNKKATWDDLTEKFSVNFTKDPRTNELFYDSKFREICKDIGFDPKYQYQLMQLVTQIQPEVLKLAEQNKLPIDHQILLTTRPLRDHPIIQKELINEIANDLPRKNVPVRVKQIAKDLETGYLKLNDSGQYVKGDKKNREIVKGGDKVLEPIQVAHMDITKSINDFLFRMTDRSITRGEFDYDKKIIQNTKDYRLSVIKVADKRTLASFQDKFILISEVALEMLELIEKEFESRDMKKEMIKE